MGPLDFILEWSCRKTAGYHFSYENLFALRYTSEVKSLLINSSAVSFFPFFFSGSCKLFLTTQFHTCMSGKHLDKKLVTSRSGRKEIGNFGPLFSLKLRRVRALLWRGLCMEVTFLFILGLHDVIMSSLG